MATDSPEVLKLVRDGLSLVEVIAGKLARGLGQHADRDELMSSGHAALVDLARRYDPSLGVPFRLFASPRLHGAMRDSLRKATGESRRLLQEAPRAADAVAHHERLLGQHAAGVAAAQANGLLAQLGVDTAGDFMAVSPKTLADVASQRKEEAELLERCLAELPADEAAVIRRHYFDGVPIDRLADELGLSRMKTRTLHERAFERLKKRLARATRPVT